MKEQRIKAIVRDNFGQDMPRGVTGIEVADLCRQVSNLRAHADALAMHLTDYVYADGDPDKDEAIADLQAYRNREKGNE